jgi:hypothetical protein
MPRFIILLRNEKLRTYTLISWLIVALTAIGFIYTGISGKSKITNLPFFAAGLLVVIFCGRFVSKREDFENDSISLAFSIAIIAWIFLQFYWIAALTFVLFLFQDISRRKLTVLVYDDRIVYPSFPKRTIVWNELNNAILKDGILTIDLKNNKLFQNEILSPTSELEFNEFCEVHLKGLIK